MRGWGARRRLSRAMAEVNPPDPYCGPGVRVVVGAARPASVPRPDWRGDMTAARDAVVRDGLDGDEGPGVVKARDWDRAVVALDDGREVRVAAWRLKGVA